MFNHELYASSLARAVDLMRKGDAKEQQKAALRALVSLAAAGSATVRHYDGVLSIDDVAIDPSVPHTGGLAGRLAAHNIAEIAIGRGAEAPELFALLKGLAEGPYGAPQVKDRLREAKSNRIWVLLADLDDTPKKRSSVSHLFDADEAAQQAKPKRPGAKDDADAYAAWNELHSSSDGHSTIQEVDLGPLEPEEEPPPVAPAVPPAPVAAEPLPDLPIANDTPLGAALLAVARRPHAGDVLDRLTVLAEHVQAALAGNETEAALRVLACLVGYEAGAADGTPRNSYRIALKRLLNRDTLVQLASFTTDPRLADDVALVLARAGAEATDVLLNLLASSESIRERKAYMNALRANPHGRDQIPIMLGHPQWFVARNVAELAGEMRLEEATPALGLLLAHADQRVRRAACTALAKIGTPAAGEPLRVAMKEGAPELRAVIASLIGSAHAAVLSAPLIAQIESEEDPETLKEMCGALARIGTPETIQALERARQASLFTRRGRAVREAAEAALKRVRRPPAP
jgi:hypothetical protein